MSKRLPIHAPATDDGRPAIWRSLQEKAHPERAAAAAASEPEVQQLAQLEAKPTAPVGRRGFLQAGTATAAAVGLSGCLRRAPDHILPHSRGPEYAVPGVPLHFATSISHGGEGFGLLVESHEGRPTKIEGNPDHPASQGATDARIQGMILELYDPDRSGSPLRSEEAGGEREAATWAEFGEWWREKAEAFGANGGQGLRLLAPPSDSPSFIRAREAFAERFPNASMHTWAPVSNNSAREGARIAFGDAQHVHVDYGRTKTIVAIDCDFLGDEPGAVRNAKRFAQARRMLRPSEEMSRLYAVESALTLTGMNADERLRLAPSQVDRYLRALAAKLATLPGVTMPPSLAAAVDTAGIPPQWIDDVAAELAENRTRGAVVVGWRQPPHVHALAYAINGALNNLGATMGFFPPHDAERDSQETDHVASLAELVEAMNGDDVDTLIILGGNPVYDAPHDAGFAEALSRIRNTVHLADRDDETSTRCQWHLPLAHELESWGDHRATDGTLSIQQPLIAPLRGGRSAAEVLALIGGIRGWRGQRLVRRTMQGILGELGFDRKWRRSLHRGVVVGAPRARPVNVQLNPADIASALAENALSAATDFEVVFLASYQTFDGRHGNNPWLLEMPDPVSKLVWDNAAYVSPATAERLGIPLPPPSAGALPDHMVPFHHGATLELSREGTDALEVPAYILPGMADNVVALQLGFGRTRAGRYANPDGNDAVGVDVYPFRTSDSLGFATGVNVQRSAGEHDLVQTQDHHSMVGRPLSIDANVTQYRATPDFPQWRDGDRAGNPTPSLGPLWTQVDYSQPRPPAAGGQSYSLVPTDRVAREGAPPRYKWGFVVDLTRCTGCSACIVACQAENNIAVVGKFQVALGREMHWMRLDRYFVGDDYADPQIAFQPVGCQHCEEAPCENVCPVAATTHSPEGLNDMAYNRCIGTRYCMNNCPYKVRRFNFLDYHGEVPELRRMQFNPNVTVRMRGVMEKCSYCVQRIQAARIHARRETTVDAEGEIQERRIQPGELNSACAQACPSEAITFGDLNDRESPTHRMAHLDRQYKLLAHIGTQPRTTYLGKIRNPRWETV